MYGWRFVIEMCSQHPRIRNKTNTHHTEHKIKEADCIVPLIAILSAFNCFTLKCYRNLLLLHNICVNMVQIRTVLALWVFIYDGNQACNLCSCSVETFCVKCLLLFIFLLYVQCKDTQLIYFCCSFIDRKPTTEIFSAKNRIFYSLYINCCKTQSTTNNMTYYKPPKKAIYNKDLVCDSTSIALRKRTYFHIRPVPLFGLCCLLSLKFIKVRLRKHV